MISFMLRFRLAGPGRAVALPMIVCLLIGCSSIPASPFLHETKSRSFRQQVEEDAFPSAAEAGQ